MVDEQTLRVAGGAVRTVGCERLRLSLGDFSSEREVTQLPLEVSALAQSHFGSLKKGNCLVVDNLVLLREKK